MKLGELKIETLMLIFPSISIDVDTESENGVELNDALADLKADPNYCDYLSAMTGAINRCFTNLESKGVLPTESIELARNRFTERGGKLGVNLSDVTDGYLQYIAYYDKNGYKTRCDFTREGSTVLCEDEGNGVYVFVVVPSIPRIKNITGASYIISLPDRVTSLMPYFVKSEVIRADDESEANSARALYEQGISELASTLLSEQYGYQGNVNSEFSIRW